MCQEALFYDSAGKGALWWKRGINLRSNGYGSQRSFCDLRLARRIGAEGPMRRVPMSTLSSGSKSAAIDCMEISVIVSGHDGGEHIKLSDVFTVAEIPLKASPSPSLEEMTRLHHLQGITLSEILTRRLACRLA